MSELSERPLLRLEVSNIINIDHEARFLFRDGKPVNPNVHIPHTDHGEQVDSYAHTLGIYPSVSHLSVILSTYEQCPPVLFLIDEELTIGLLPWV